MVEKRVRAEAKKEGVRVTEDAHEILARAPKGHVFGATEATVMVAEEWEDLLGRLWVKAG